MGDEDALALLHEAADAVVSALAEVGDWSPLIPRGAQHGSDLVADRAALAVLTGAGVGVLSEESGLAVPAGASSVVVVDPLDGSTNASRRLPWYATSLCAVIDGVPAAAVVHDHGSGRRFTALRNQGAWVDGVRVRRSGGPELAAAIVGLSGLPPRHLGWYQFRAFGAAALDLCAVAEGRLDAFVDCSVDAHGVWDYLGGLLVCQEAGVPVEDRYGRPLLVLDPTARRTPVAGATDELLAEVLAALRQS